MSIKCLCGCKININHLIHHLHDKKHDEKIFEKKAPTMKYLANLMERLDNIKEKLTENEYIIKCNKLKNVYNYWKIELYFTRKWDFFIINNKTICIYYFDHRGIKHDFHFKIKSSI
jgi:hypothetical protein